MLIRAMTTEDIPQVAQIETECFSLPWSENSFADSLKREDTIFLVCETNNPQIQMCEKLSGRDGRFLSLLEMEKFQPTSHEVSKVGEQVVDMDCECPLYEEKTKEIHEIYREPLEKLQNELNISDKKIIGYIGMYLSFEEGEITNVAVTSSARKKGVGNALINAIKEVSKQQNIQRIILEVRASNTSAIMLYEKNGFVFVGKRKNFYEKPTEDANIMICEIDCKSVI